MQSEFGFYFVAADFLIEEVHEHWDRLKAISSLSDKELSLNFSKILQHIDLFNMSLIDKSIYNVASDICRTIDLDDVPHVAMALFFDIKLWTGDTQLRKGLEKKGYFICANTREIIYANNLNI
jgi:predicted nucleic acid-binding protein